MSMSKKTISLVILVCMVFVTTLLFNGCSDDWVEVGGTEHYTIYYKPSSVNIDKQNKTIKALTKQIYNENGVKFLKDTFGSYTNDKDFYANLGYSLHLYLLNYKEWKYTITQMTSYSKSGDVLSNNESLPKWENIEPNTISVILLRQLIKEYNIKM